MLHRLGPRAKDAAFLAICLLTPGILAVCTREHLLSAAEAYVAAQAAGNVTELTTHLDSSDFTYWESNLEAKMSTGVLTKALRIDHHRTTLDTAACASYTELIATSPTPYVLATQLRHDPTSGLVTKIDTVPTTTNHAIFFNASQTLAYVLEEDWSELAPARRSPREVLLGAVDAYLDMWSDAAAFDRVPWGEPCRRVEGSRLFEPCTFNTPRSGGMPRNGMRRYVIDEVVGSAQVLCEFTSVGRIPDSHEIRLVDGKTRFVHTVTGCATGGEGDWPSCKEWRAAEAAAAKKSTE
jgi:hypothetical protein